VVEKLVVSRACSYAAMQGLAISGLFEMEFSAGAVLDEGP